MDIMPPNRTAQSFASFSKSVPGLWEALKHAAPETYSQVIKDGVESKAFTANQALGFPLARSVSGHLGNLAHQNPNAPGYSRDERLLAWFESCTALGADPLQTLAALGEHGSSGFGRLVTMKCFQSLFWWRGQGVEMKIAGPAALRGEPTTLATIAFLQGSLVGIETLLPGSHLTHIDVLWRRCWSKRCVEVADDLTQILQSHGLPPEDVLTAMAGSAVNQDNIDQVLSGAARLVNMGASANTPGSDGALPLAISLNNLLSPAGARVVEFLLAHGADPLGSEDKKTAVELALERWVFCAVRSHLRPVYRDCFAQLTRACPQKALMELFPPDRLAKIEAKICGTIRPANLFGQAMVWSADQDVAALQGLWLELHGENKPLRQMGRARL